MYLEDDNSQKRRQLLPWMLVFSLVVHLFTIAYLNWTQSFSPITLPPPPIEIVDVPEKELPKPNAMPQKKIEPQVVETEKSKNQDLDKNSRFLSDRNQKVDKETKAKQVDDFREHQGTGMRNRSTEMGVIPPTAAEQKQSEVTETEKDGISIPKPNSGVKRDWKTLSMKDLSILGNGQPMGATDDRLDNVQEGEQTVLNTREFQYYSYYYRIKQTLRQYWKPNVERRLAVIWHRGGKLKDGEMITELLVLLDDQGAVTKISTIVSSGITDIDDAAVEAFHRAGPFPNPPKGIVDRDGLVRIRWDFILKAAAAPAIQFRRPTGGYPP